MFKRCPFCGAKGGDLTLMIEESTPNSNKALYYINCGVCHMQGPIGKTEKEAEKAYNIRDYGKVFGKIFTVTCKTGCVNEYINGKDALMIGNSICPICGELLIFKSEAEADSGM